MRRAVNIGPVTGHAVRSQSVRNRIPEGRGLALINPRTGQVSRVTLTQASDLTAAEATRTRVGRGASVPRSRGR